MRNCFLALFIILQTPAYTQESKPDTVLRQRLEEVLEATRAMDFNRILHYTYPRILEMVPKDALIASMRSAFEDSTMKIGLDSLQIVQIFPVFKVGEGSYARIVHSLIMTMRIVEKPGEEENSGAYEYLLEMFSSLYGPENVRYDPARGLIIKMKPDLIAIRNSYSPEWTFLNIKDPAVVTRLLEKEVLDKFATYK